LNRAITPFAGVRVARVCAWQGEGSVAEDIGPRQMEEQLVRVRLGAAVIGAAGFLLAASAVGLLGAWALGLGLALVVGTSVATAIVWEERDAAPARAERELPDELVGAQAAGR
jgi:hypothetical protein